MMRSKARKMFILLSLLVIFGASASSAQLLPCDKIDANGNVNAPGGCIGKTLEDQVGAGHGDVNTFGSAVYLIKRDPARSVRRGRQLFQRKFSASEGLGPRVNFDSSGDITQNRAFGAALSDSCAGCHGRPRGSAGVGGDVTTFPDSRDAPHLFGLGLVEQLADEMTTELRALRDKAIAEATSAGTTPGTANAIVVKLIAKGVRFGKLIVHSNGTVDTSQVEGVDPDLRVKPFFHEGRTISMREFIVGALNDEMGLQAWDPVLCAVTDPIAPQVMTSPAGFVFDPALDTFARPFACSAVEDPDGDGIPGEIDPALLDHLEFYLLNYFKPGQDRVTERAKRGLELMHKVGCTSCHVQNLTVDSDRRVADVETNHDPVNGIFNQLFATASTRFVVFDDGDTFPQLLPGGEPFVVRNFFSDLKRHDLGPAFHERDFDGSRITEHVTEPLWGVGSTGPYGHDGRSMSLDQVIRRHGGEAAKVTETYLSLSEGDQSDIHEFLRTLILFPPDDTASNLNPGVPGSGDPQDPANHGSINLGALFQIPSEGGE